MANLISLFRVILAFYLLIMLDYQNQNPSFYWTAVCLTLAVILLDALDGWVARKFNEASKIGSIIDILGDRIVENAYWIVFAYYGWIGVWVPLIVMTRSFVCDTLRGLAFAEGCTAFGSDSMVQSKIGRFLTASRFSRAVYGGAKVFAFMAVIACHVPNWEPANWFMVLTDVCVWLAVIFCVLRGLPVVIAGKKYFTVKHD